MPLPPDVTDQPPASVLVYSATQQMTRSLSQKYATATAAYAAAQGLLGAYSGYSAGTPIPLALGKKSNDNNSDPTAAPRPLPGSAGLFNATYKFYFYSATCYLKLFWSEVVSNGSGLRTAYEGPGTVISSADHTWEWTGGGGAGGLCLPAGFDLNGSPTSWNVSPEFTLHATEPPEPGYDDPGGGSIYHGLLVYLSSITAVRYSCVPGYVPPADGSANGFPA